MNNNIESDRKIFRARLDHHIHPAQHIETSAQLKGRNRALSEMQDGIETAGTHPFIWGTRGIGKTSVAHTACEIFEDEVELCAVVACGKDTEFPELIADILSDSLRRRPSLARDKSLKGKFSALGFTIEGQMLAITQAEVSFSPNQATNLITDTIKPTDIDKTPVVIVDEFDRLQNKETFQHLSDMLKQMSATGSPVKFIFCGVTRDLNDLLGAHESVERYIHGVRLSPLTHDAIWEIVKDVEDEFKVKFERGQLIRISQIAAGYPHFAHLILKNTLLSIFESGKTETNVSADIFRDALNRSAERAATRLRTAYENAVRRGTDRYIEVLFAVANSQHLIRQFKDIVDDYERIMLCRDDREGYDTDKKNGQDLRNALNALKDRGVLRRSKTGWYEFEDPMLRSYVRLMAQREGIELSDDTFRA